MNHGKDHQMKQQTQMRGLKRGLKTRWPAGLALLGIALTVIALATLLPGGSVLAQGSVDYDIDDDGLIEVSNLWQFNAIRDDLDGGGWTGGTFASYTAAFRNTVSGMAVPTPAARATSWWPTWTSTPTATASPMPAISSGTTAPAGTQLAIKTTATSPSSTATATPSPTCTSTAAAAILRCSPRLPAPALSIMSA